MAEQSLEGPNLARSSAGLPVSRSDKICFISGHDQI